MSLCPRVSRSPRHSFVALSASLPQSVADPGVMASVEEVTQEDARAWELLQQQRADAELAAKAAQELADQAREQVRPSRIPTDDGALPKAPISLHLAVHPSRLRLSRVASLCGLSCGLRLAARGCLLYQSDTINPAVGQAMAAFDDCTAVVNAQQGAKVAADMQAREISKQKFHDAQREKAGTSTATTLQRLMHLIDGASS